ncbi:MAG: hypothetical protein NHB15_11120 [Methanosarcina barkeri]|nr:hypothetical protein [Methanosarcina sp. ERenArc_MAG2]
MVAETVYKPLNGSPSIWMQKKAVIYKHCEVCPKLCPYDVLEMIEVEDNGEIKITDTGPAADTSPVSSTASHKDLSGSREPVPSLYSSSMRLVATPIPPHIFHRGLFCP